jgi:hypothetical protein
MFIDPPPDELWVVDFAVTPAAGARGPRFVSAAGGLVVAVGESLHMLRPGSQRLRSRPLPADLEVVAVAAEPWSPYRLAIASPESVAIYSGHRPHEPSMNAVSVDPEHSATHLAWTRSQGKTVLDLRLRTGELMQLNLDDLTTATFGDLRVQAIASDATGTLALLDLAPVEPNNVGDVRFLGVDGVEGNARWIDCGSLDNDDGVTWTIHLALCGKAVAYAVDPSDHDAYSGDANVSWEEDEDDGHSFKSGPGVFQGPIAFQNERVIFCAYNVEGRVSVLRWERDGSFTRIARFGMHDDFVEGTPATVTALAWDEERRVLWAASPELGLIKLTEPPRQRAQGIKAAAPVGAN